LKKETPHGSGAALVDAYDISFCPSISCKRCVFYSDTPPTTPKKNNQYELFRLDRRFTVPTSRLQNRAVTDRKYPNGSRHAAFRSHLVFRYFRGEATEMLKPPTNFTSSGSQTSSGISKLHTLLTTIMNLKTAAKQQASKQPTTTKPAPTKLATDKHAIEQTKPTARELSLPYDPSHDDIVIELLANANKIDTFQPDITGTCKLGELEIDLALWLSETRDGTRTYYSLALTDSVRRREALQAAKQVKNSDKPKIEPLHKLKLYEFRKSHLEDPDFTTPEAFIEGGDTWWGSMWVLLPEDSNDVENIRYFLVFSHAPFRPALTGKSRENAAMGVARLIERRKELEDAAYYVAQQAKRQAILDTDDLP
jgi:hypothetical protein